MARHMTYQGTKGLFSESSFAVEEGKSSSKRQSQVAPERREFNEGNEQKDRRGLCV